MTNQKEPNIGVSFQARIKYKGGMVRGFRENTNTYFVYKPYSRTKGHRYTKAEFDKKYQIIPQTQLWHKDLTRALNKIYKTGLWTNLSDIFENLLKMEWDDYQIIKQKSFDKNEKENLYQKYHEQYPFLFDDTHQIRMTVSHASMNRELHNDWVHAERPIVKFEMSYSQFMEAFCNLTSGTGIPCTINFTEKDGQIPECKYISKEEEFQEEFQKKIDEVNAIANSLYNEVKEIFATKKSLSKADRNSILQKIDTIINRIPSATKFAQSQFEEQMEKSATEARGEIENFFQNKINAIASGALQENLDMLLDTQAPNIPQLTTTKTQEETTNE